MNNRGWNGLPQFSKDMYQERYFLEGEDYDGWLRRVTTAYADDQDHAYRVLTYIRNYWFHPSTPISSNAGVPDKGLPISCFTNTVIDSKEGIFKTWEENNWLGAGGGGIGTDWSNVREMGAKIGESGESSGIVPFIKVSDSTTLAVSQGGLRRASQAVYLDISHPEILEFIDIRQPTGDGNRRSLNIHHGVKLTDEFMEAVVDGTPWELVSPKSKEVVATVDAYDLWKKILISRMETGEPYLFFSDNVNKLRPEEYKNHNMKVTTSNLCSEIMLHTANNYSGVCCLTSMNLEYWDEYKTNYKFFEDIHRFTDNVLQSYIGYAYDKVGHHSTTRAALHERSIGIGVMGLHSLFQSKGLPFGSLSSKYLNQDIFSTIKDMFDTSNRNLGQLKGIAPISNWKRNTHVTAVAPTASISTLCNLSSPGIDPRVSNVYTAKTNIGSYTIKNKYLITILEKYGKNDEATWKSIQKHQGSVQHLEWMSKEDKEVFLTAYEMNNQWIVDMAADRTPYIDQGASTNLFLPADVHVNELHTLHYTAWEKGMKSLYYCRSTALNRAVVGDGERQEIKMEEDTCLSCS